MIATHPVARWTWGRDDESSDAVVVCIRDSLAAWSALHDQRLAVGQLKVRLSVPEAGHRDNNLYEGVSTPDTATDLDVVALSLADDVRNGLLPGEIGGVRAEIECAGILVGPGGDRHQEGLFRLDTEAFLGYVTTDLTTRSDAWMRYDLKGREQSATQRMNAPRLAAALHGIAAALGTETDPDDPTSFGSPTESGVENRLDEDGFPANLWARFEVPQRNSIFHHGPVFDSVGYKRSKAGQVLYVLVVNDQLGELGYLWASDAAGAASFEPLDSADEEGYKAGLIWLDRLREAHRRGLKPSEALVELSERPADSVAGHVERAGGTRNASLVDLRELALNS